MSKSIEQQLKNINVNRLKTASGRTLQAELRHHAAVLTDCILYELDKVYQSFSPAVYERSYDLYNAFEPDETVTIDLSSSAASIGISVGDEVWHDRIQGGKWNVALAINNGWQQKNSKWRHVYHLGYLPPTHFIERGIERYRRTTPGAFPVKLTILNETKVFK